MVVENKTWRFLDSGKGSAMFNMAADLFFLEHATREQSSPVFRLYQWSPPAVSIGYSQTPEAVINDEECMRKGIDIVRRPTGGRAVYHCNELAYSVIAPISDPFFGGTILESYKSISRILCSALKPLGIDAKLTPGTIKTGIRSKHLPCFVSTSYHEVTLDGKKLIGSAQRRIGHAFLQHGSILLGPEHEYIIDISAETGNKRRSRELLLANSIDILTATGSILRPETLAAAIFNTLESELELPILKDRLTDDEISSIQMKSSIHDISGRKP